MILVSALCSFEEEGAGLKLMNKTILTILQ